MINDVLGYWSKRGLFAYQADITNGAGGAGAHTYTGTIPDGSAFEILYGNVLQGDPTARVVIFEINDGSGNVLYRVDQLQSQDTRYAIPSTTNTAFEQGVATRWILGSGFNILVTVVDVAASENSAFAVVGVFYGDIPTWVEAGASTPVININLEGVF